MITHLKDRQYYIDLYDRNTVDNARRNIKYYDKFFDEFQKKLPTDETVEKPGNALILNVYYMQSVGMELLNRYENRDDSIDEWISEDELRDKRISNARLTKEPNCQHCNKNGLRIINKSLMHRRVNEVFNDHEEVLFMLHCSHCDKNSAFWEDGTVWKTNPTLCPKCNEQMTRKTKEYKKSIDFLYTCPSCHHSYKEKLDFKSKKEAVDPNYNKDRAHYCLLDKEFRDHLFGMRQTIEDMAELGKEFEEKAENKHIYDAIDEIKKPKIAELTEILRPVLERSGYVDFNLERPEIGKDVIVGFSCLDSKSDRNDYDSKKTLQKLIKKELGDTNWRLMSDGVSYRLGYLSGRLRAYESEKDLMQLVIKSDNLNSKREVNISDDNNLSVKGSNGEKIIL